MYDTTTPNLLIHDYLGGVNGYGACNMENIYNVKSLWIDKEGSFYSLKGTGDIQ